MDLDEIIQASSRPASTSLEFISSLANQLSTKLPRESNYLQNFFRNHAKKLTESKHNPDLPFYLGSSFDPSDINESSGGGLAFEKMLVDNIRFWRDFSPDCLRLNPSWNYERKKVLASSSLLNQVATLVYKNNQQTGAHITVNTLHKILDAPSIIDTRNLSASEVLAKFGNCHILLINSLQVPHLWRDFDEFICMLKKQLPSTTVCFYFHETLLQTEEFLNSRQFQLVRDQFGENLRLFFVTQKHRDAATKVLDSVRVYPNILCFVLGNILPFSSNRPAIPSDIRPSSHKTDQVRTKYILIIGSIQERKGFTWTKRLCDCMHSLIPDVKVVWIGFTSKYSDNDWQSFPPNMLTLGPVFNEVKWAVIRQSSLLLVPSEDEPYSLSAAEAIFSGIPCAYRNNRCGLLDEVSRRSKVPNIMSLHDSPLEAASQLANFFLQPLPYREDDLKHTKNLCAQSMTPHRFIYMLRYALISSKNRGSLECRDSLRIGDNQHPCPEHGLVDWQSVFNN